MDEFLVNKKPLTARGWLLDSAVALSAFGFACAQLMISSSSSLSPDALFLQLMGVVDVTPRFSDFLALGLVILPLVLRRKFTWLVFIFVLVVFLGTQSFIRGDSLSIIGPVIALYTVAREKGREQALVATVISVVVLLLVSVPDRNQNLAMIVKAQNIGYMIAAALAGFAVKTNQEYVEETEKRAEAAEKGHEEEAARRVEEERVRIAREVHDITAHSLSAVSIQAAAAERLIDTDPAAAKEAIKVVRKTSKDALGEIRSMIGVLRGTETQPETAPTQGTDRMSDLVHYLEQAGLSVTYDESEYERNQVPAYIDVALFGIAREAVTNIVKHAQAHHASLRLASSEAKVTLTVEDDGRGSPDQSVVKGNGLEGIQERVHVLDGSFEAKPRLTQGFMVNVRIPFDHGEDSP